MAYFAPYIDGSGLHMPTYEDRLEELWDRYCEIFGVDPSSKTAPDYQLLSALARRLDDVSALIRKVYESCNPLTACGHSLDLLLPRYGLRRNAGETDEQCRGRMLYAMAARGAGSLDALNAAVRSARGVRDARIWVNDTDSVDSNGIPGHSIAVVTRGGVANAVAQAIFDKKPPGIGTYGSTTGIAVDAEGGKHTVPFSRYRDKLIFIYLYIRVMEGGDPDIIQEKVVSAVNKYLDDLGLATPLNVTQLYGAVYASDPEIAKTFVVSDIQVNMPGASGVVRDLVPCAWNEKLTAMPGAGVSVRFI